MIMLVFVALGFVLLRPLCEAAAATHHAAVETCCAVAEDGTFLKAADPLASAKPGSGGAIAAALAAVLLFTVFPLRSRGDAALGVWPPQQSYYARSARIQR